MRTPDESNKDLKPEELSLIRQIHEFLLVEQRGSEALPPELLSQIRQINGQFQGIIGDRMIGMSRTRENPQSNGSFSIQVNSWFLSYDENSGQMISTERK